MSIMNLIEKGKKSLSRRQEKRSIKDTGIGAAIGLAVGAVAGVLLSPRSGRETRKNIAASTKELSGKAKNVLERAKEKVEETKEELLLKKAEKDK
jgi:gas vesicle protein